MVISLSHTTFKEQGGNLFSVFVSTAFMAHHPWKKCCRDGLVVWNELRIRAVYVEECLSRLTHRKWMWGGPGKTTHCVSAETIAIHTAQWQPSCLCSELWVFSVHKHTNACEWSPQSDRFLLQVDFSEAETESFQTGDDAPGYISASSFCFCGKLGDFRASQTICVH